MVQVLCRSSRENNPTLPASVVDAVQSYIDAERLAGCRIPSFIYQYKKPINIEIQNVQVKQVQADIIIALESLFKKENGDNVMVDLYYHQDQSQFHLQKLY